MADRIQCRQEIPLTGFYGTFSSHPQGVSSDLLAEVLARVAKNKFKAQIDETWQELFESDGHLVEVSQRIELLVSLWRKSNAEMEKVLKEIALDPSCLDANLYLLKIFEEYQRFNKDGTYPGFLEFLAVKDEMELQKQIPFWLTKLLDNFRNVAARPISQPVQKEAEIQRSAEMPPLPKSPPLSERVIKVAEAKPHMPHPPQAKVWAPPAPVALASLEPYPVLPLPSYEHRYQKMDAELREAKLSLDKLRSSIKVLQAERATEPVLLKNSPLFKRLFERLAALFGRLISPGLNIGRQIKFIKFIS